jgi:hypothetical protein
MSTRLFLAGLVLFGTMTAMTGCGTITASTAEINVADFGPRPENVEARVKTVFANSLKDPDSALYKFGELRHGWYFSGLLNGAEKIFGWVQIVDVNAKNSYGGYVGYRRHYIFFDRYGMVYDVSQKMDGRFGGTIMGSGNK